MKKKKVSPLSNVIVGIILIAIGIKGIYWITTDFTRGYTSKKWPTTTGNVLEQSITKELGKERYQPHIRYNYTVDEEQYINDTITYPTRRGEGKTWAEDTLEKYSSGSEVIIYYNPENPAISCLEPGANYFFLIIFSLLTPLLVSVGIILLKQAIPFSKKARHDNK